MTVEEVTEIIRLQAGDDLRTTYCHGVTLEQALVTPKKVSVIARSVRGGKVSDQQPKFGSSGRKTPAMDTKSSCAKMISSLGWHRTAVLQTSTSPWSAGMAASALHASACKMPIPSQCKNGSKKGMPELAYEAPPDRRLLIPDPCSLPLNQFNSPQIMQMQYALDSLLRPNNHQRSNLPLL